MSTRRLKTAGGRFDPGEGFIHFLAGDLQSAMNLASTYSHWLVPVKTISEVEAEMISVGGDPVETIINFKDYEPRYADTVRMTFKFSSDDKFRPVFNEFR